MSMSAVPISRCGAACWGRRYTARPRALAAQVAVPVLIAIQVAVPLLFFLPTRTKTEEVP